VRLCKASYERPRKALATKCWRDGESRLSTIHGQFPATESQVTPIERLKDLCDVRTNKDGRLYYQSQCEQKLYQGTFIPLSTYPSLHRPSLSPLYTSLSVSLSRSTYRSHFKPVHCQCSNGEKTRPDSTTPYSLLSFPSISHVTYFTHPASHPSTHLPRGHKDYVSDQRTRSI
jgi:hypothetical protein